MTDCLLTEVDSFSTFPQLSVATTRWKSFKVIHGEVENLRRLCFYFEMMICCCWWMCVLQRNRWTGREPKETFFFLLWDDDLLLQGHLGTGQEHKEKIFILCDDEMLPLIDVRPSNKLMDRSRTEGENVSTLRWWSVAADGSPSFKVIDGQVKNRRRNCFYFAMMICCCKQMWVLQGNWWTDGEPK